MAGGLLDGCGGASRPPHWVGGVADQVGEGEVAAPYVVEADGADHLCLAFLRPLFELFGSGCEGSAGGRIPWDGDHHAPAVVNNDIIR